MSVNVIMRLHVTIGLFYICISVHNVLRMLACWQLSVYSAEVPRATLLGKVGAKLNQLVTHSRSMLSVGSSCMAVRPKPCHSFNICLYFTLPKECLIWHCVPLQTFRWSHMLCHQSCVNHIRHDTQCVFGVFFFFFIAPMMCVAHIHKYLNFLIFDNWKK